MTKRPLAGTPGVKPNQRIITDAPSKGDPQKPARQPIGIP
jgi:hypothetical protein